MPVLVENEVTIGDLSATSAGIGEESVQEVSTAKLSSAFDITGEEDVHEKNVWESKLLASSSNDFWKQNCVNCIMSQERIRDLTIKLQLSELKVQMCQDEVHESASKIEWLAKQCAQYEERNEILDEKCTQYMTKFDSICSNIQRCFTSDQLQRFEDGVSRGRAYTSETITASIAMWFAMGKVGYQHLVDKKFPLPSISTLHKNLANVHFPVGRAPHLINLLSKKVNILIN
jgi:hypothetical protein